MSDETPQENDFFWSSLRFCTFGSNPLPHLSKFCDLFSIRLRAELLKHNYAPGPICHGRKQYKKQLCLLEQGLKTQSSTGTLRLCCFTVNRRALKLENSFWSVDVDM